MSLTKKIRKWLDSFPVKDAELEELEKKEEKEVKDEALAKANLPVQLKEIQDTYDRWLKDAAEGKLDVSKLPIELKEIKDQGPSAEELAKKREKELLDASGNAAKTAKDAEEEEKEEKKEKCEDQDDFKGQVAEIQANIKELRELVAELASCDKEVEDALDAEEVEAKKEEEEEEKKMTGDAWNDLVHRAEVLNPGMGLKKPAKGIIKTARDAKVKALTGAFERQDVKDVVSVFTKDGDFSKLSKDALDAAFLAASEMVTKINNSRVQKGSIPTMDFGSSSKVVEINKRNKEFYIKK